MDNITPVCGFKDSEGRFWETEELALESNYRNEVSRLTHEIVTKIYGFQRDKDLRYYREHFYIEFPDYFKRLILSEPNLFLSLIWKIVKHDFKQKMK